LKNQIETQRAETAKFTERDYNQEFREALIKHPRIEKPPLFALLSIAEKLIGLKVWLVENAIWEAVKDLGAQVSDEEKEYFPQLVAKLKREHTEEVQATVEKVARAFNPSADEDEVQVVISNAINTSSLAETTPHLEVVNQPTEEYKPSLVSQAQSEPATQANIETLKKYLALWGGH
jgi:hypothetical protein